MSDFYLYPGPASTTSHTLSAEERTILAKGTSSAKLMFWMRQTHVQSAGAPEYCVTGYTSSRNESQHQPRSNRANAVEMERDFSLFIEILRGGHPSPSGDREEPRPPFDCRFRLSQKEVISMKHKRAYQYRCYPTPSQRLTLARTFGCARFVYNWALRLRSDAYRQHGEHLFYRDTSAALTTLKHQPETAWLSEVSCVPPQQALRHLDKAFKNFFGDFRELLAKERELCVK